MNYKLNGAEPNTIILHGGPGAIGSASGLAKEINNSVELYSKGQSIEAQLEEISDVIDHFKMLNPTIIGHSWGAWLAFLYASKYNAKKIILVGCGAFETKYLSKLSSNRNSVLSHDEQIKVNDYFSQLANGDIIKDLKSFGYILAKMDSYKLGNYEDEITSFDYIGHKLLMKELNVLRSSGELLKSGVDIKADVVIIHGINDPHPVDGVKIPFESINLKFKIFKIENCGHTPWNELYAKDIFFNILKKEL